MSVAIGVRVSVDEIVSSAGYRGLPLLVTVLGLLSLTLTGFVLQSLSFAAPALVEVWMIPRSALGPALAASQIGMAAGAILFGPYADRRGRRVALIISTLLYALGSLLCASAENLQQLVIWRFCSGVGLGAPLIVASSMINEFAPRRWRSLSVAGAIVGIPLGGVAGSALAAWLIPAYGWQSIFVAGAALPCILAIAMFIWLPESPKFLSLHPGQSGALAAMLNRLAGSDRYYASQQFVSGDVGEPTVSRVADLFGPTQRAATLTLWAAFFSNFVVVYFFYSWLPTVLGALGLPLPVSIHGALAFNLGGLPGALLGAVAVNWLGSRMVVTLLGTTAVIGTLLLSQNPLLAAGAAPQMNATFMLLLVLAGMGINGMQTLLYVLAAQAFPTSMRATGVGSCGAVGRIASVTSVGAGAAMLHMGLSDSRLFMTIAVIAMVPLIAMLTFRKHIQRLVT